MKRFLLAAVLVNLAASYALAQPVPGPITADTSRPHPTPEGGVTTDPSKMIWTEQDQNKCAVARDKNKALGNPFECFEVSTITPAPPITPQQQYVLSTQACDAKAKSGQFRTAVAAYTCGNSAIRTLALQSGFPWMDLENLCEAQRLVLAEKIDAHKITTPAEVQVEIAKIDGQFANAVEQRKSTQQQQNQADFARRLEIINAIDSMGPIETTCDPGHGGSFECTTGH